MVIFGNHLSERFSSRMPVFVICILFLFLLLPTVHAQSVNDSAPLKELGWLESAIDPIEHLTTQPTSCLAPTKTSKEATLSNIGAVAFRSPYLFGGLAARKKLSCHACHQNGGINQQFFIKGLSDQPGRIDATNAVFSKKLEDHIDNPIDIPSLYDINEKTRFGTLTSLPTKREFVRHVIETEFDGLPTHPRIFDGLMSYIDRFVINCNIKPSHKKARSVKNDFDHVVFSIEVARQEWEAGETHVSNFILLTARHELSLIHERYNHSSLRKEQNRLLIMSRQIEKIQKNLLSEVLDVQKINLLFKRLKNTSDKTSRKLISAEEKSFYNKDNLSDLIAVWNASLNAKK